MNQLIAKVLASIPAAAAPAAIFAFAVGAPEAAIVPFFVALGHALVLGLPAASLLMHAGHFRLLPMLLAGAVVGLLPAAVVFFPTAGSVTASYVTLLANAAGLGAAGGLGYYVALQGMRPNASSKPTSLHDAP